MPLKEKVVAERSGKSPAFFSGVLNDLLTQLPERSQAIVKARFGVNDGEAKTLEEIGRSYRITRERVRQVVGSALGYLAYDSERPQLAEIVTLLQSTFERKSGILQMETLLQELVGADLQERGALSVFLDCLSVVNVVKATKEIEQAYALKVFSLARWSKVKDAAKNILLSANQALDEEALFARYRKTEEAVSQKEFFDYLAVSKEIKQNVFGKWGMAGWSDIRPRGTREKAYLVLRTFGKPLHFRDIAARIDEYGLQGKKKSHPQTVHNELIKDKRFVLVGRGIYALSEWGFKKGTVKEVVEEILRTSGKPLTREEILVAVLKVRQVKKSTIIINLNTFFSRVGKNAYTPKR